jgi:hypothetical protein
MRMKRPQTKRTASKPKVDKATSQPATRRSTRRAVSTRLLDAAPDAAPKAVRADGRQGEAFIPDPNRTHQPVPDDLAEYLGESFVAAAVTGDDVATETQNELVPEELGGPFVDTDVRAVFAENINLAMQMDAEEELDAKLDALLDGEPASYDDFAAGTTTQEAQGFRDRTRDRTREPEDPRAGTAGAVRQRNAAHRIYVPPGK